MVYFLLQFCLVSVWCQCLFFNSRFLVVFLSVILICILFISNFISDCSFCDTFVCGVFSIIVLSTVGLVPASFF